MITSPRERLMTANEIDALVEDHGGQADCVYHADLTYTVVTGNGLEIWVGLATGGNYPSTFPVVLRAK